MLATASGIVRLARPGHPEKALSTMLVTAGGITTAPLGSGWNMQSASHTARQAATATVATTTIHDDGRVRPGPPFCGRREPRSAGTGPP